MASDNTPSTVELPANPKIKQLAHEIERDGNEYAVPLLLDFYEFLAIFDEEDHVEFSELLIEEPRSELSADFWVHSCLEDLVIVDIVKKHLAGTDTYTLDSE